MPVSRHRQPLHVYVQGDSGSALPDSHAAHAVCASSVVAQGDEAGLAQHDPERVLFMMFQYKVAPCSTNHVHDWSSCPFSHTGERARRRCPNKYTYTAIACPNMKQAGACPVGDACPFAHNDFEYWLHPERYQTAICKKGATCQRKVCFFAHQPSELRTPARRPRLPPGAASAALQRAQTAGATGIGTGGGTKAPFAAASAAPASAISLPASPGVDAPATAIPTPAAAGPPVISLPRPRSVDWMRWPDSSGLLNDSSGAISNRWSSSNCPPSSNGNSGSTRVDSSCGFSNSVLSLASQVGGWSGMRVAPEELRFAGLQSQEAGSSQQPLHNAAVAALLRNQVASWCLVPLPASSAQDNTPQPSELPAELVHALQGSSYPLPLGLLQGPHSQSLPDGTAAAACMAMGGIQPAVMLAMAEQLALSRMDAAVANSLLANLLSLQALQQLPAGLAELEAPRTAEVSSAGALGGLGPQCSVNAESGPGQVRPMAPGMGGQVSGPA